MKKLIVFVCMALGVNAFVGCSQCGSAQSDECDSVAVDSDSISVVEIDSLDSVALDSIVCPN